MANFSLKVPDPPTGGQPLTPEILAEMVRRVMGFEATPRVDVLVSPHSLTGRAARNGEKIDEAQMWRDIEGLV